MEVVFGITVAVITVFVLWTAFCLVLKGMFKIADKIFGL